MPMVGDIYTPTMGIFFASLLYHGQEDILS